MTQMLCRRFESKQSLTSMVNVFAESFNLLLTCKWTKVPNIQLSRSILSCQHFSSSSSLQTMFLYPLRHSRLSVYVALREFNFALQILRCRNPPLSRRLLSPPQPRSHTLVTKMLRRLWAAVHQNMPAFLHPFILPPILIGSTPAHPLLAQVCAYILTIMQKNV